MTTTDTTTAPGLSLPLRHGSFAAELADRLRFLTALTDAIDMDATNRTDGADYWGDGIRADLAGLSALLARECRDLAQLAA